MTIQCETCDGFGFVSEPKCCGNKVEGECKASCAVEDRSRCDECYGLKEYDPENEPCAVCEGCECVLLVNDYRATTLDDCTLCISCVDGAHADDNTL